VFFTGVALETRFSGRVRTLQDRRLPEPAKPAGYAALIDAYGLEVPLPRRLAAIRERHHIVEDEGWLLLTPRHAPRDSLESHLTFALKREGVDLLVLRRLFLAVRPDEIAALVERRPTGAYARRVWFLYEWLTGRRLPLPDAGPVAYVDAVDPALQYAAHGERSARHRVRNNLPGTPDFCPLVFRTEALDRAIDRDLSEQARAVLDRVPADIVARAAAFLLLDDSKASFAIEGERPPRSRIERWGRAIGQAGARPLDLDELLRLQRLLIGDDRFVRLGLREEGGFLGERDRDTLAPIPSHISARVEDLPGLLDGLIAFVARSGALDPVIAAAGAAFGFVYIHPFEDGNGRIHRWLIHHVLAERGFSPRGLVFPVSSVILREIAAYRRVLEAYSRPRLPLIEWEPTERHNVRVLDDTADLYRFFDATPEAEFLYRCVETTIRHDLPRETAFLQAHDGFLARVQEVVDMPSTTADLLFRFLSQHGGALSGRAREREFSALTEEEVARIEELYTRHFGDG